MKSGAFVVVEREQLAQVLREQGLGMTGAISPQTAAKAGKLLGLQALVTGKITDFDADNKTSGFGGYYQKHTKTFHARVSSAHGRRDDGRDSGSPSRAKARRTSRRRW